MAAVQSLQTPRCYSCFMATPQAAFGHPTEWYSPRTLISRIGTQAPLLPAPPPKPSLLRRGQVGRSGTCSGTRKHLDLDRVLRGSFAPWPSPEHTCVPGVRRISLSSSFCALAIALHSSWSFKVRDLPGRTVQKCSKTSICIDLFKICCY